MVNPVFVQLVLGKSIAKNLRSVHVDQSRPLSNLARNLNPRLFGSLGDGGMRGGTGDY